MKNIKHSKLSVSSIYAHWQLVFFMLIALDGLAESKHPTIRIASLGDHATSPPDKSSQPNSPKFFPKTDPKRDFIDKKCVEKCLKTEEAPKCSQNDKIAELLCKQEPPENRLEQFCKSVCEEAHD